jgi:hypothetical protein
VDSNEKAGIGHKPAELPWRAVPWWARGPSFNPALTINRYVRRFPEIPP